MLIVFFSVVCFGYCGGNVLAADRNVGIFYKDSFNSKILGQSVVMEKTTISKNGMVYIPVKYLAKAIGVTDINEDNTTITMCKDDKIVKITKGSMGSMQVNGEKYSLLQQLAFKEYPTDRQTYVAVRLVAKAFDYDISWNEEDSSVMIWKGMPLLKNDFIIGKINIGKDNLQNVNNILGNPLELSDPRGGLFTWRYATYPGVAVYFDDGDGKKKWVTNKIRIFTDGYPTARGLKVGDSLEKMVELYGHGYLYNDKTNMYYYTMLTPYWYDKEVGFVIVNNIITEIIVIQQVTS